MRLFDASPAPARDFDALIGSLCELLGIAAPAAASETGGAAAFELEMEGVAFLIAHDPVGSPGLIHVHARFGKADVEDAAALTRLLEVNLAMSRSGYAAFGIDGSTRDLVHMCKGRLAVTADTLLASLQSTVDLALNWRNTGFETSNAHALPSCAAIEAMHCKV